MSKATVTHDLDNIPDELKAFDQWLVCNNVKVPLNARTGGPGSTTNPATWSSFEKARVAVESGKAKYAGFVLTEGDLYTIVDLDHVIDLKTGEILPEAQAIIGQMDSYTETSQSGTGIHIIVRGKKPGGDCKHGQVEIYETKRYFALTGNVLDSRGSIKDRQEQLNGFYAETFGGDEISGREVTSDLVFDRNAKPPSNKLKRALRDDKFRETWEHRRTDLSDDSFSGYDASLASLPALHSWSNQEIVDTGIAIRREHGDENDIQKGLRPDYWKLTLSRVERIGGGLAKLKADLKEIVSYGEDEDGEIIIYTQDGRHINMGTIFQFLTPAQAYGRLYLAGYVLSTYEKAQWSSVVRSWRPSLRIESTSTKIMDFEHWLINDMGHGATKVPMLGSGNLSSSLSEATDPSSPRGVGLRGYAQDDEGRLYINIPSILERAQYQLGKFLSGKRIAGYLRQMEFKKLEDIHIHRVGYFQKEYESKHTIWVSKTGYMSEETYLGKDAGGEEKKGDKGGMGD